MSKSNSKTTKKRTSQSDPIKKPNEKIRTLFIQIGLIVVAFFLAFSAINDVRTYQNLKESISDNRRLLAKTKEEEEQLELTKRNLTNPDYLEFVARGRYYASRPGEQVFVFPELAQEYSQADDEFYDDEILREEEASKNQSLQQAAQNNANTTSSNTTPTDSNEHVDSGIAPSEPSEEVPSDQDRAVSPEEPENQTEPLEQPSEEVAQEPSQDPET